MTINDGNVDKLQAEKQTENADFFGQNLVGWANVSELIGILP